MGDGSARSGPIELCVVCEDDGTKQNYIDWVREPPGCRWQHPGAHQCRGSSLQRQTETDAFSAAAAAAIQEGQLSGCAEAKLLLVELHRPRN